MDMVTIRDLTSGKVHQLPADTVAVRCQHRKGDPEPRPALDLPTDHDEAITLATADVGDLYYVIDRSQDGDEPGTHPWWLSVVEG